MYQCYDVQLSPTFQVPTLFVDKIVKIELNSSILENIFRQMIIAGVLFF